MTSAETAIRDAAERFSNWGRWAEDDPRGTMNFIDESCRLAAAATIRTGEVISLAMPFDSSGPQTGWRGRTNPVRTMLTDGLDADAAVQGFPHGFGGADDVVFMPLQCGTQWDGLGHIFDRGFAWNGRRAAEVVTSSGDQVSGMERNADRHVGRGVLLDVGALYGEDGVLPPGFAITSGHLQECIAHQGPTAQVRRGDMVLVRTGQLGRAQATEWGDYAGGDAPGLSFESVEWFHSNEIAAAATDTWGFEVRPNEFPGAFQPMHQVLIPHMGFWIGEMWALDALAAACAADGRYEALLVAAPLPFTGAVGSPINPLVVR